MLFDSEKEVRTIRDAVVNVNPLARELRVRLWKQHLAFDGANEVVKSAASTIGTLIERPAAENTIKSIQRLARENSILYRQAFPLFHGAWMKLVRHFGLCAPHR